MNAETILVGKRILLIDSDTLFLKAMRMIFRKQEIDGLYALNLKDALEVLKHQEVDAILLNIQLPDTNELASCKQIREQYPYIPIIVMTAFNNADIIVNCFEAGADDYVTKPPNTKILLQRLANSIARREAEKRNIRLMKQLESYIPESAINEIAEPLGIHSIQAAILYSDMRGFTAATFDHAVEKVFSGINEAMTMQSLIIQKHGGYIDGFAGDGMLAIFDSPDCCQESCLAAAEIIQEAHQTSVDIWNPLPIAIGINYGKILRGDLGSSNRKAHTVIGSAVNVSARLCGVAKAMEAVCSEYVVEQVDTRFQFSHPSKVQLKGLPTPINAYPLLVS